MSSRSRKRQSRLAFTPLPSSSPAAKDYHQQIQDRAAAVTYQGSLNPAKRRKMANGTRENEAVGFMPTPATSVPRPDVEELDDDDDDEQPVQSTQKRRKRARQQRLDFEPSDGAVNLASPTGPSMFGSRRQQATQDMSSDESEELPSPGKLVSKVKHKSMGKGEDGFMGSKTKRVTRSTQKTPEPEVEEDEDDIVVRNGLKSNPVPIVDDDEEEDAEDSEDQMPTTAATQRRRGKQRESSFISSSPPAALESDDDIQIIDKPKRKRKASDESDSDDDEDLAPRTPGRRKLKAPRNLTQQEQEDLNDDLEFLGPSSDIDESRVPRSTQSKAKNARQKALEKLKQQRSSQRGVTQTIQEEDEDEDAQDQEGAQEYDEMYNNSEDEPALPPTSSRAMFDADEDDDDFLAEDNEDGLLGVPDGIPLAFTRYASMKAKELFKFAVDWMVQKKINPAFNMHDEIYDLTFKKLDDEVAGLVGSKFASAAWTPEFTMAVRARPEIAYNRFSAMQAGDDFFHDKCDACNRSGHPATYEVQFQGNPYHRETLDEVATTDDDDDDDDDGSSSSSSNNDDDKPAYDAQGREIAPANKIYFVGKFCMSNAKTAHALQHWRYHLYEWVVEWINEHGYSTAKRLEKREKNRKKPKKLRKEANGILDRMVEEGVVKMLWHQFRDTIDEAANSKQGRYAADSP